MLIVSFAMTTAAFVAKRKSVTRREWSDEYYERVRRALEAAIDRGEKGLRVQGWSASPHRKGKKIGEAVITSLTREPTHLIPDSDWEAEGFAYMTEHGINVDKNLSCEKLWRLWRQDREKVTAVVRFEVVSIEPGITEEEFWPKVA